jgi:hypothetical protein
VAAQSAAAERQDSSATREAVTADRKLVLQAAIVRVMKARKSLPFQRLVGEVLEHVAERFRAPVPLVKHGDRAAGREGVPATRRQRVDTVSLHFVKSQSQLKIEN